MRPLPFSFSAAVSSFVAASAVAVVLAACSSSSTTNDAANGDGGGASATVPGAGAAGETSDAAAPGSDASSTKPKNDCNLSALSGVADVTPTFVMYQPPASAPATMAGGTLKGQYKVDKATVFLPSGSAGLVDPKKSTGSINAWAVFAGTSYRLKMKADFLIESVIGPQTQATDSVSQGGFTVTGAALLLDHACDSKPADEADYSFTDDGSGRATILIKTPSPYGDTYLQLEASKN